MAAALTLAILMMVSLVVVRVASVALRLTGLPNEVARFQSLSALTGTGFTTHEAEMIVNYPIRRKILSGLMVFGNLGIVSVSGTFIIAFVGIEQDQASIVLQSGMIVAAIIFTLFIATNQTIDRALCGFIGWLLNKMTSLGQRHYDLKLQIDEDVFVAEHLVGNDLINSLKALPIIGEELMLLGARTGKWRAFSNAQDVDNLERGTLLICYGAREAHDRLEAQMLAGGAR